MSIALIRIDSDEIVKVFTTVPASVTLPGVGSVSPVHVGWKGGGEITYVRDDNTGKETAIEGPARFAIVTVEDAAPVPDGQRIASITHERDGEAVRAVADYEPLPKAAEEPTLAEKLERATGLTIDEIKAALK